MPGGTADPVGERGAVEINALPGIDLRSAIERQMIGVFGDQNLGDRRFGWQPALDEARRRIAKILGVTTTNIHYHFGKKLELAAVVLDHYADDVATRFRTIWTDKTTSLSQKMHETIEFNRITYHRFNPSGNEGRAWSLLSRFIADSDALDDGMRNRIMAYRRAIHASACEAVEIAVSRAEAQISFIPNLTLSLGCTRFELHSVGRGDRDEEEPVRETRSFGVLKTRRGSRRRSYAANTGTRTRPSRTGVTASAACRMLPG